MTSFVFIVWHTHTRKSARKRRPTNPESDIERSEKRIIPKKENVFKLIYFPFLSNKKQKHRRVLELGAMWNKNIVDSIRLRLFRDSFPPNIRLDIWGSEGRPKHNESHIISGNNNENWFNFFCSICSPFKRIFKIGNVISLLKLERHGKPYWNHIWFRVRNTRKWNGEWTPVAFARHCHSK